MEVAVALGIQDLNPHNLRPEIVWCFPDLLSLCTHLCPKKKKIWQFEKASREIYCCERNSLFLNKIVNSVPFESAFKGQTTIFVFCLAKEFLLTKQRIQHLEKSARTPYANKHLATTNPKTDSYTETKSHEILHSTSTYLFRVFEQLHSQKKKKKEQQKTNQLYKPTTTIIPMKAEADGKIALLNCYNHYLQMPKLIQTPNFYTSQTKN